MSFLGAWFDKARTVHVKQWKTLFLIILGLFVVVNIFVKPHHAEYGLDNIPGFWAAFGLVIALLMVFVMKKIIYPLITGPEDTKDE
jgi:antibiotic biosynthesis monooxygenase (ABM) superfamily enzyme